MAGARPISHNVKIENEPLDTATYAFELPDGSFLFAFWTNGVAQDKDSGIATTLTFPDQSAHVAVGIDVLYGFEQELITDMENGNLVIRDLLVRDYPFLIKIIKDSP